jgi:hypothetical protein
LKKLSLVGKIENWSLRIILNDQFSICSDVATGFAESSENPWLRPRTLDGPHELAISPPLRKSRVFQ